MIKYVFITLLVITVLFFAFTEKYYVAFCSIFYQAIFLHLFGNFSLKAMFFGLNQY